MDAQHLPCPRGALGSLEGCWGSFSEAERFLCPECMGRLHPFSSHPFRDGGAAAHPGWALSSPQATLQGTPGSPQHPGDSQ